MRSLTRCKCVELIDTSASAFRSSLASLNDAALLACRTAFSNTRGLYPSVPKRSLWSSGKKNATALRTRPLLAPQLDLPGERCQLPFRQRFVLRCDALARLLALGTAWRPILGQAHGALHVDMFLQEKSGQFL